MALYRVNHTDGFFEPSNLYQTIKKELKTQNWNQTIKPRHIQSEMITKKTSNSTLGIYIVSWIVKHGKKLCDQMGLEE